MQVFGVQKTVNSWCGNVTPETLRQAEVLVNHPCLTHIALMPGACQGIGTPVGCVAGFEDAILPRATGDDMGRGVIAARLNGRHPGAAGIDRLIDALTQAVPAGGTHRVELMEGDDGRLYVMAHDTQGVGKEIVARHHGVAVQYCSYFDISLPDAALAFLPTYTPQGARCLADMAKTTKHASDGRRQSLRVACAVVEHVSGLTFRTVVESACDTISREVIAGKSVWVHRHGAIPARAGQPVLLVGLPGAPACVAVGRGNTVSLFSCSSAADAVEAQKELVTPEIVLRPLG